MNNNSGKGAKKAYILLQNGRVFEGERFGAEGDAIGGLVFTTGMVGYLETLTDPAFHGQIVLQTYPLIGNYGVITADFQSKTPRLSAYVVREWCEIPSNFRSDGGIDAYLKESGVIGLCGIDAREITRILRENGDMNAAILSELPADIDGFTAVLAALPPEGKVSAVTCVKPEIICEKGEYHAVIWDFGYSAQSARFLAERGCKVTAVPASFSAEEIIAVKPDGIFLSSGPGDPSANAEIISEIGKLAQTGLPIFGMGLGHQLLALSMGAKTFRLKYGHRGANQSVQDVKTGGLYVTPQNHGYAVDIESLPENITVSYVNLNDGTCEGLEYSGINAFSVQFRAESGSGPKDTGFLFDRFISMMRGEAQCL